MLSASTFQFLKGLKKNNNKPWFDAHRNQYDAAKKEFEQFIQEVIDALGKKDITIAGMQAKNCIFRINRDVRFSKDKSPYKINFGASINAGGKKAMTAGYYFHFEPGEIYIGGGIYQPMPDLLKKIRQEIDYNFEEFMKLLKAKKFASIYTGLSTDKEYMLSRVPKGYEPDNPAAEFLKMKSYIAMIKVDDNVASTPHIVKTTVAAFEALIPLVQFFNRAIEV